MVNIIVAIIILAVITAAITKIIIEKQKGVKCIGCPYSKLGCNSCGRNDLKQ